MLTTNLLDRIPVDRISTEARQVHLGRALLTLLVGVFWLLGWLAGKATLAIGFACAAAKVGYLEARSKADETGAPPRGRAA